MECKKCGRPRVQIRSGWACRPCRADYMREWSRRNHDAAYYKRLYQHKKVTGAIEREKAARLASTKRWRDRNPEKIAEWQDANREKRLEHNRAYTKAYWKSISLEQRKHLKARARARRSKLQREALGRHSLQEWLDKCALLGNVCIYCGEAAPLTRDHKIPLVRGGTDDIGNVVPACRPCNTKKNRRTAIEYLAVRVAA